DGMNEVWKPQANIEFELATAQVKQITRNLNGSVLVPLPGFQTTGPLSEELRAVTAVIDPSANADVNIFFVKDIDTGTWLGHPPVDPAGVTLGDNCPANCEPNAFVQDVIGATPIGNVVAHEVGHIFDVVPADYPRPAGGELMDAFGSGCHLRAAQIILAHAHLTHCT